MDWYKHQTVKFADAGLQLRLPVDLVPPAQYAKLTNVIPVIEGQLQTRAGLEHSINLGTPATSPGSGVHTLDRLNQPALSVIGDRIAGYDTDLFTLALPTVTTAVRRTSGGSGINNLSGNPLTLATFRFDADQAVWLIVGDRERMYKYRGGTGSGYFVNLGIEAPADAATASAAGSSGNLDGDYDWRYTWYNNVTGTESNPSPVMWAAGQVETRQPLSYGSPDANFGGTAFSSISLTPTVTGTGNADSATESRQSVLFYNWPAASAPYQDLTLVINVTAIVGPAGRQGTVFAAVYFSLDGGTTWKPHIDTSVRTTPTVQQFRLNIPASQDLTLLQVRIVVLGIGDTLTPQNITARRIRQQAGNFNLSSLLTGGSGDSTIQLLITGIATLGTLAEASVNSLTLSNDRALVCVRDPSGFDAQVNAIRLYRRGGSLPDTWNMVGQYPLASLAKGGCGIGYLQIEDNIADSALGDELEFDNDPPITSVFVQSRRLPYIWGPFGSPPRLLGCGDPDRPGAMYFSKAGNADQWPAANWLDVTSSSDPLQGGVVYNTRCFAFSYERMYELVPNIVGGTTFVAYPTPCARGLISPWGVAVSNAIYFVAKDGVYRTTGGEEESLVENDLKPLFPTLDGRNGQDVNGYEAIDMERIENIKLSYHNDEIYFIYRGVTSGNIQVLAWDERKQRWRAVDYSDAEVIEAYSEQATTSSLLLGDASGNIYATRAGNDALRSSTSDIPVTIRTGSHDQGEPLNQKEYGSVVFDIDPGGADTSHPVIITPYVNGNAQAESAIVVTGSGRQQVPLDLNDIMAFNLSFEITWSRTGSINPILYQYDILWRSEPTALTHWEVRETSHGLLGWQHIRDMYVCIRSTSDVTLILTVDGIDYSYMLPSTSGERRKLYLPLKATKGKLFRYRFDSSQPFRLYQEDCEVRVKPWLTNLGYTIRKPFGGEGQLMASAITEAT